MTETGQTNIDAVAAAVAALPRGTFIITSAFEDKRAGVRVRAAMHCATDPALIAVAVRKGHWIEPIIRDSHTFALCQLDADDRLTLAKFCESHTSEDDGDAFEALPVDTLSPDGPPVPRRATLALECEVVRHFDLEADHELYIGQVLAVRVVTPEA